MSRTHRLTRTTYAAITLLATLAALSQAACGAPQQETQAPPPGAAAAGTTPPAQDANQAAAPGSASSAAQEEMFTANLLFADDAGLLKGEPRDLPAGGSRVDRARRVVEALLDGPRNGLTAVLPVDTALRAFYLDDDGTAYVDFDAGFSRGLAEGSEDVLLAATSLAGTLAANFPEVRQVRILVEGSEVADFGGHFDLSRPIPARAARP